MLVNVICLSMIVLGPLLVCGYYWANLKGYREGMAHCRVQHNEWVEKYKTETLRLLTKHQNNMELIAAKLEQFVKVHKDELAHKDEVVH